MEYGGGAERGENTDVEETTNRQAAEGRVAYPQRRETDWLGSHSPWSRTTIPDSQEQLDPFLIPRVTLQDSLGRMAGEARDES